MSESLIETAEKYRELAHMIMECAVEESFDTDVPDYVQNALLRLYYAISLQKKIEVLRDGFSEETPLEAVEAVEDAADAADKASVAAFDEVEDYTGQDKNFNIMIESLSVNSAQDNLSGLLYKLYKCEKIIRMAYRLAGSFSIYGSASRSVAFAPTEIPSENDHDNDLNGLRDTEPMMMPEDYITEKLDIDIRGLLGIRARLMENIHNSLEGQSE